MSSRLELLRQPTCEIVLLFHNASLDIGRNDHIQVNALPIMNGTEYY